MKAEPTILNEVNTYKWTVSKADADGKIVLGSYGFIGGGERCGLHPVTLLDVAPTKNPKLMLMAWSYDHLGKSYYGTVIALADRAVSKTTNNESAASVKNASTSAGDYYFVVTFRNRASRLT